MGSGGQRVSIAIFAHTSVDVFDTFVYNRSYECKLWMLQRFRINLNVLITSLHYQPSIIYL